VAQIRDLKTFQPLPGVEIGELGGKFGFLQTDNGWMQFHSFRIPRGNMLAKLAEVTAEGQFEKKTDSRIGYGAMMRIRTGITFEAGNKLSKAATIAVRYGAVRKQFKNGSGEERTVLDYQMQQYRVLTQLANAYVFKVASIANFAFATKTLKEVAEGDSSNFQSLHTELACFKMCASQAMHNGVEILR
jgi:acyl-CoA oxidase